MPEPGGVKDKDRGARWLIAHHGDAVLRIDLVRWQAGPAALVLPTEV